MENMSDKWINFWKIISMIWYEFMNKIGFMN
jgi:hypothetical protein